ncbi:expressed protein [Dictyostelium purpureum]|uniref:Expressed protein n=1 Tax=Dictyostelium purpureum TaxID=5786 RepID=F0ZHP6_DICPU|nr:uncharacterized protein DICPUDRAFT_94288 [Dictyostelium purpureum]EGC36568.1 expressed protein [Dictyostelium purpureum]|eukprot:XP_003286940.1 expressed protein [Dictyostelium purpureum]
MIQNINFNTSPTVEYILKEKKEIISKMELKNRDIKNLFKGILRYSTSRSLMLARDVFPNFDFEITSSLILELISYENSRYDIIECLYYQNLIPNLQSLLYQNNLPLFSVRYENPLKYNVITVTKSMFILIHTIIKNQKI